MTGPSRARRRHARTESLRFVRHASCAALLAATTISLPVTAWEGGERADAAAWLQRMEDALSELDYAGTFVLIQDERVETMRILHRVDAAGERERLVALDGSAREVIRDATEVRCILPDAGTVLVDRRVMENPLRSGLPAAEARLDEAYRFELLRDDRVAGRPTRVFEILPRDRMRYGQRYWLDVETGLPLRSEVVDPEGRVLSQLIFTGIEVGLEIPDRALEPAVQGEEFRFVRASSSAPAVSGALADPSRWVVEDPPPAFLLAAREVQSMREPGTVVEHLLFSDGFASVSVYIEQGDFGDEPLEARSRLGSMNAYAAVVNGHLVTAVGAVPALTVERLARALRLRPRHPQ